MKVFFITRFSIYDSAFGGFRLSTVYERRQYERRLFDKNRLDRKFAEFESITFPSIVGQSCDDWAWLIYTSDRLPDLYCDRLDSLVKDHGKILVATVRDFGEFFERTSSYGYGGSYATVRIDDDDGLNTCYVEKLKQYAASVGSIVSFTEGALAKLHKGKVIVGDKVSERNNAQGLAGIGLNIYRTGRHSDVDARYHVIYDATPDMFLLTCSQYTDTGRGFTAVERIARKARRLITLLFHRPGEVPGAFAEFLRKRLRH